ncbi:MAG: NAD(P)-dependent glycerol-3-phosphate dehydrogenase [Rhodocyclaceae bacterium]|nr:NAD(P)-dependent glycerol-3-phosphate dehydrogenase [Rhodocyclaceae bacterium]
MNIGVLAAGAWGTALAANWAQRHHVCLWAREPEVVASINGEHINHQFLPRVALPPELKATGALADLCSSDVLILATPVAALRVTLQALKSLYGTRPIPPLVWVCKGFEPKTGLLPHQVVHEVLGDVAAAALSGPSFAQEVACHMPTAVTIGSRDLALAEQLADWLHTPNLRLYASGDVVGVEVGGAVKNVLAIATGICDGLSLGHNARAALMTRGIAEIGRLCERLGGHRETLMGLSGLGDLILTCTGDLSRNRQVGLALGQGKTLEETLAALGHVAEGVGTAREVARLSQELQVEMPIARAVAAVIAGDLKAQDAVAQLMSRAQRAE